MKVQSKCGGFHKRKMEKSASFAPGSLWSTFPRSISKFFLVFPPFQFASHRLHNVRWPISPASEIEEPEVEVMPWLDLVVRSNFPLFRPSLAPKTALARAMGPGAYENLVTLLFGMGINQMLRSLLLVACLVLACFAASQADSVTAISARPGALPTSRCRRLRICPFSSM